MSLSITVCKAPSGPDTSECDCAIEFESKQSVFPWGFQTLGGVCTFCHVRLASPLGLFWRESIRTAPHAHYCYECLRQTTLPGMSSYSCLDRCCCTSQSIRVGVRLLLACTSKSKLPNCCALPFYVSHDTAPGATDQSSLRDATADRTSCQSQHDERSRHDDAAAQDFRA